VTAEIDYKDPKVRAILATRGTRTGRRLAGLCMTCGIELDTGLDGLCSSCRANELAVPAPMVPVRSKCRGRVPHACDNLVYRQSLCLYHYKMRIGLASPLLTGRH
jgi:hypothetical protein